MEYVSRVAAYGLALSNSKILLCRLSAKLPHLEGQWTLPGGGIEFGESPEQAVIREVQEETGLLVRIKKLADVDSHTVETHDRTFHAIRILYHVEYLSGELAYELDGTTDMCDWFTLEDAKKLKLVGLAELGLVHAFSE